MFLRPSWLCAFLQVWTITPMGNCLVGDSSPIWARFCSGVLPLLVLPLFSFLSFFFCSYRTDSAISTENCWGSQTRLSGLKAWWSQVIGPRHPLVWAKQMYSWEAPGVSTVSLKPGGWLVPGDAACFVWRYKSYCGAWKTCLAVTDFWRSIWLAYQRED